MISEKLHKNQFPLETQSSFASAQAIQNLDKMDYFIIMSKSQW